MNSFYQIAIFVLLTTLFMAVVVQGAPTGGRDGAGASGGAISRPSWSCLWNPAKCDPPQPLPISQSSHGFRSSSVSPHQQQHHQKMMGVYDGDPTNWPPPITTTDAAVDTANIDATTTVDTNTDHAHNQPLEPPLAPSQVIKALLGGRQLGQLDHHRYERWNPQQQLREQHQQHQQRSQEPLAKDPFLEHFGDNMADDQDDADYSPIRYTQADLDEEARAMMQEIAAIQLHHPEGQGGGQGSQGAATAPTADPYQRHRHQPPHHFLQEEQDDPFARGEPGFDEVGEVDDEVGEVDVPADAHHHETTPATDATDAVWDSSLGMGVNRQLMRALQHQSPEDWFMRMVRDRRPLAHQQQQQRLREQLELREQQQRLREQQQQQQQQQQLEEQQQPQQQQQQQQLEKAWSLEDAASGSSTTATTAAPHRLHTRPSTDTIFEDLQHWAATTTSSSSVQGGSPYSTGSFYGVGVGGRSVSVSGGRSGVNGGSGGSSSMRRASSIASSSGGSATIIRPVKLQKGRRKYWRSESKPVGHGGDGPPPEPVTMEIRQDADDPYFLAVKVDTHALLGRGTSGDDQQRDTDTDTDKQLRRPVAMLEVYTAAGRGLYDQELYHMPPRPLYGGYTELLVNMKRAFQHQPDAHYFARVRAMGDGDGSGGDGGGDNGDGDRADGTPGKRTVLTSRALDGIVTFPTHYS